MEEYVKDLYVISGWVLWCTFHSFLISIGVTEYMKRKLGVGFRFYRLFYNAFSLATLIPLLWYSASIRQEPLFRWEGYWVMIPHLLLTTGVCLFIVGGWNYNFAQMLGIRQIKSRQKIPPLARDKTFVVSGIHGMIRHPWYLGGILIVWAGDLSGSKILNNMVLTSYFIIGSILEERKLVSEFGEPYREYQKNVSMLFPYRWMKARMIAGFTTSRPRVHNN